MIKPDAYNNIGKIISMIEQNGFVIGNLRMTKFSLSDAQEFYGEHKVNSSKILKPVIIIISKGKPFFDGLVQHMCSDFVVGMELIAENCILKWRTFIGPTNCQVGIFLIIFPKIS